MTSKNIPISEIKDQLLSVKDLEDPIYQKFLTDERIGVQKLILSCQKRLAKAALMLAEAYERQAYERQAYQSGYHVIAGIDEVGRGPLAGPVIAAAVILPEEVELIEVNDSKQVSEKKRDLFYEQIMDVALAVGIGVVSEGEIDQLNIYQATKLAMKKALANLDLQPDCLLIDAMSLDDVAIHQENIIKGDAKSVSIAAASIVAKVTRDRLMKDYGRTYPGYGFENNAGYGTKEHLIGLEKLGPCPIHRKTFAPVKNYF